MSDDEGVESRSKMLRRHKAELLAAQKAAERLGKKRAAEGQVLVADCHARHAQELDAAASASAALSVESAAGEAAALAPETEAAATSQLAAASLNEPVAANEGKARSRAVICSCIASLTFRPLQKPSKAQKRRAQKSKEEARCDQHFLLSCSHFLPSRRRIARLASRRSWSRRAPPHAWWRRARCWQSSPCALLCPVKSSLLTLVRRLSRLATRCAISRRTATACTARWRTSSRSSKARSVSGSPAASVDPHLLPALTDSSAAPPGCDVPALRASTAAFMRAHEADYRPFLDLPEQEDAYEAYCCEIEATAAWGGQLELRALAHVLRRRILVFSAHMETVEMGCEYGGEAPLRVAYQQHAYGLGEHFNSVVPAVKDEVTL